MNSELNQSVMLEAEVFGLQNTAQTDHSKLENLDYEHSGHTGFQPAGDYVEDSNYVHTDNNYTTEEKTKLSNLENYDDTEIKADIQSLEDTKVDKEVNKGLSTNDYTNEEKTKLAGLSNYDDTEIKTALANKQNNITSTNKLDSSLVDDSLSDNKFVTPTEKTTWNNKSNFSGNYNDLTNKPTIPTVPTNVSAFTNDAGYLTSHQDISGKEDKSNKVTSITSSSTNTEYPSALAVYTLFNSITDADNISY